MTAEAPVKKRQVDYAFEVLDEIPESEGRAPSQLEKSVQKILGGDVPPGKAVIIGRYSNRTAASAAANTLRQRHGWPEVNGLKFECHRQGDKSALFVIFDPSWIKEGEKEKHTVSQKEHKAKLAEQAKTRRLKKDNGQADGGKVKEPAAKSTAKQ